MFKFQTTTILNSLDNMVAVANDVLHIKKLGKFNKANVTKIFKRAGDAGKAGKIVLAATVDADSYYRLKIDLKLSGNNNAYYSNAFVLKGKPVVYEFKTGASDGLTALEAVINKQASRFGDVIFTVSAAAAGTITLEVAGEDAKYIDIPETVTLEKYDDTKNAYVAATATVTYTHCVNPFGTYEQLIKDLRLPTAEAVAWKALASDERPALGVTYNQYIIYMCVNRGIMGGDAVGETTKSITAHSIWVPATLATTFETELAKLASIDTFAAANLSNTDDDAHAFAPADNVIAEPDVTE